MDEKVLECMQYLIQRGNDVILYTDQDRKELTEGTDKYGKGARVSAGCCQC